MTQSTEGKAAKEKSNNVNNKIHICTDNNREKRIYAYTSQQVP